jgi:Class III cytochrome C family
MKRAVLAILMIVAVAFVFSGTALAQAKAPGVVVLKGNPMGGVKFDHTKHMKAGPCTTCHHPSKPEKAMKGAQENCSDCHTKTPTAPMKTTAMLAFHSAGAKSGLCIDCHVKKAAEGNKAVPGVGKCADCHKKENV